MEEKTKHCGTLLGWGSEDATMDELREYYLQLWPKLLDKWAKAKAAKTAFVSKNPLGKES